MTEGHSQDRIGLDAGEFVNVRRTAFELEVGKTAFPKSPLHHRGWALDSHEIHFGFGLRAARTDNRDDAIDVGQCQQESFDDVLALPRCAEQVLGSSSDDRHTVANELLEDLF